MVIHIKRSFCAWLTRLLMLSFAGSFFIGHAHAQPGVSLYTIPVVFHVLHQSGPENISDAQIASAIAELNADFDAPTVAIDPPFDMVAGDMDVTFVLASAAPDGSPTTGIDRIETPLTNDAGTPESYLNPWPRNRYLNIWTIGSFGSFGGYYLTERPELSDPEPCTDGIMIYSDYVGAIGTSTPWHPSILSQAVGRFLNLKMLYEDPIDTGICGDDEVADTPPCGPPTCVPGPNPCSALPINERNFMFSPYATNMFTVGQRERVHACLNSTIAQRNELVSGNYTTSPDCSTGIRSVIGTTIELELSPMPFHDRLLVSGLPPGRYQVEFRDAGGRIVHVSSMISGQPIALDNALAPGAYVLAISNEHMSAARLVVKE